MAGYSDFLLQQPDVCACAGHFTVTATGTVTDAQGGMIADATGTATNLALGVRKTVRPNAEGIYTIPFLLPGAYAVPAEADGFQKFISEKIRLEYFRRAGGQRRVAAGVRAGVEP